MSKSIHTSTILVKPPDIFLETSDLEKSSFANCTFSTVSELRALLNSQKQTHRATKSLSQEDYDQVEKLNNFRMNSAAGGRRISKRFTNRRKISVTYDPSKIMQLTTKEYPIIVHDSMNFQEKVMTGRNKSKLLKDEYSKVTTKNKLITESLLKDIQMIQTELEKFKKSVRSVKDEVEKLVFQQKELETTYHSKMNDLQQQETTVLLYTRNSQGRKVTKAGEVHGNFFLREKIRQEKTDLHANHQLNREKILSQLTEKRNEKESMVMTKREWKKELSVLKSTLISNYLKILKQGLDVRDDGLRWVIKALWELKQAIPLSTFPSYLDEQSSQFLLTMTLMELEMAEYQVRLDKTRDKMKEERTVAVINRNTSEMLNDVRGRIKEISRSAVAAPVKKNGEFITLEIPATTTDVKSFANEITWIKENIERIQKNSAEMMEKEAFRVSRNFKILPKEIGISHILRALLGAKVRDYMKFAQV